MFMKPEAIFGKFIIVETTNGTEIYPEGILSEDDIKDIILTQNICEDNTLDYETVEGWFGRLSASGYMDCTEWSGPYQSEEEALRSIEELYGLEQEDD